MTRHLRRPRTACRQFIAGLFGRLAPPRQRLPGLVSRDVWTPPGPRKTSGVRRLIGVLGVGAVLVGAWQVRAVADGAGDLGAYMIRNAYHFSTMFHAARAGGWDLAEYEAEEVEETLESAEAAEPEYAPLLQQFRQEFMRPLRRALTARDTAQFDLAFRAAVQGCNNCHVATQHPFIVVPQNPPRLSILQLTPSSPRD